MPAVITGRVLVDVNVPMYAAGLPHPNKDACVWAMGEVAAARIDAAIDAEAIQEILYRYGRVQRWDVATTMARSLLTLVPVVYPVSSDDVRLAIDLFARYAPEGVAARDLVHAAVMLNNGVTQVLSTDAHFDRVEGITRLDPVGMYRQQGGPSSA